MKLKTQALLNVFTQAIRGIFIAGFGITLLYLINDGLTSNEDTWIFWGIALLCIVIGGYFMYRAYKAYQEFQKIPDDTRVVNEFEDLHDEGKIQYLNRNVIILFIGSAIMSVWSWYDISALEAGDVDSIKLYFPISLGYKIGGLWGGVFTMPIIFVLVFALYQYKTNKIKNNIDRKNSTLDGDI